MVNSLKLLTNLVCLHRHIATSLTIYCHIFAFFWASSYKAVHENVIRQRDPASEKQIQWPMKKNVQTATVGQNDATEPDEQTL